MIVYYEIGAKTKMFKIVFCCTIIAIYLLRCIRNLNLHVFLLTQLYILSGEKWLSAAFLLFWSPNPVKTSGAQSEQR